MSGGGVHYGKYCEQIAPDLIPDDNLGHSNDGWGLRAADALELAGRLQTLIDRGEVAQYARERDLELEAMPSVPCTICDGTGFRAPIPHCGRGTLACNGCESTGRVRPFASNYPFSLENVQEWVAFLRDCGGFEIC